MTSKAANLTPPKEATVPNDTALKTGIQEYDGLSTGLNSSWAAIRRGKRVIHDFAERVATACTSLLHAQVTSYREYFNSLSDSS